MLYEFDRALSESSWFQRIGNTARGFAPKFKITEPNTGVNLELDFADLRGTPSEEHLLILDALCEKLSRPDKPTLLLLDEFQELAWSKDSAPLIAGLRTSLDKRSNGLKAVFTGSSQEGLRKMFSVRDAPFLRYAAPMSLPKLDDRFVDHQLQAYCDTYRHQLDRSTALDVFRRFDQNPEFFQRWLTAFALLPGQDIDSIILDVQQQIAEEFGFGRVWLDLKAIQRVVARMIAENVENIYGEKGAEFYRNLTGSKEPSTSAIQSAVARLSRLKIIDKIDDQWRFVDGVFEVWVRDRPPSDF